MFKYIKLFPTHSEYETFINGQDTFLPNVSYCIEHNGVHYKGKSKQSAIYYNVHFLDSDGVTQLDTLQIEEGQTIRNPDIDSQWYVMGDSSQTIVSFPYIINEEIWFIKMVSQNNIITYYAPQKLEEITSNTNSSGLHINAFNVAIISHTFENGKGIIEFENSVTYIGTFAFVGCAITSITIPNCVTEIGRYAFSGCTGVTSVGAVGSGADVEIPNGVTIIGEGAFNKCSGLTGTITIPNGITSIGRSAFRYCTNITSVTIPNSITGISTIAFSDCTNLRSVQIGSGITSIGEEAFAFCEKLINVTICATTPPLLDGNAFYNNSKNRKIFVPAESVEAYKTASSTWSMLKTNIEAISTT